MRIKEPKVMMCFKLSPAKRDKYRRACRILGKKMCWAIETKIDEVIREADNFKKGIDKSISA
jgi:hypothetical protein